MKKTILIISIVIATSVAAYAQKFAYVDTEYILGQIPEYKAAQTELDKISVQWQKEIEAKDLQKQRFGVDGELFKKRQELVKPIQDKVYNAVKAVADKGTYSVVFDKSSDLTMLYANSELDKSDAVLEQMGYKVGSAAKTAAAGTGTKK
jgi:outer membrane protein